MNYKNFLLLLLLITSSCTTFDFSKEKKIVFSKNNFTNKGFALTYSENLFNQKVISKKIDERSLIIFQKNLKKGSIVKIKNLINNNIIIAKVGFNSNYPIFYNSVLSQRIAKELKIDPDLPYIEIFEILENSSFIANRAKTYEEEKNVATKAPVSSVIIKNLNKKIKSTSKIKKKRKFNFTIKIADFYFDHNAKLMTDRINNETNINNAKIMNISPTQYRVYLGPFNNLNSLQKAFNDVNILQFDNIEIIKND